MKKIVLISLLFLATSVARSEEILISLYEYNPWNMVVGSDSPTFILYENGTTIFWNAKNKEYQYTQLDKAGVLKEMNSLVDLDALESDYTLSGWTDQPTQVLTIKLGSEFKSISLYGDLRNQEEVRTKAPDILLSKYDHFIDYSASEAKSWRPNFVEVMIWPYEYAPDKSITWPKNWPDIDSESTKKRGDSYSIFLPYKEFESFKVFIATRNKKGAVEINGKKWAVSTRIPFPHETALNKTLNLTPKSGAG